MMKPSKQSILLPLFRFSYSLPPPSRQKSPLTAVKSPTPKSPHQTNRLTSLNPNLSLASSNSISIGWTKRDNGRTLALQSEIKGEWGTIQGSNLRGVGSMDHRPHHGKQEMKFYQHSKRRNASVEVAKCKEDELEKNIQVLILILDAPAGISSPPTPFIV